MIETPQGTLLIARWIVTANPITDRSHSIMCAGGYTASNRDYQSHSTNTRKWVVDAKRMGLHIFLQTAADLRSESYGDTWVVHGAGETTSSSKFVTLRPRMMRSSPLAR